MKVIQVSDELFERLKNCVVDPFDDTPESVIGRLINITDKAKSTWSPLDAHIQDDKPLMESHDKKPSQQEHWRKQAEPVL